MNQFRPSYAIRLSYALLTLFLFSIWLLICYSFNDQKARLILSDLSLPITNLMATLILFYAAWKTRLASSRLAWIWFILALAQLSYTLGDISWSMLELGLHLEPFPSIADVFYLLFYPLFLVGILHLPTEYHTPQERIKTILEIAIVMICAGLYLWTFLIGPMIVETGIEDLLSLVFSVAYPFFDLLLLLALLVLLFRKHVSVAAKPLYFLTVATAMTILVDTWFGILSVNGTYQTGSLLDSGYFLSYILFGLSGLHQLDTHSTNKPSTGVPLGMPHWLHAVLPSFTLIAAFFLFVTNYRVLLPISFTTQAVLLGSMLLLGIILQQILIRENTWLTQRLQRMNVELENRVQERTGELALVNQNLFWHAYYDTLTSLPNRALLMNRLNEVVEQSKNQPDYRYAVMFLDVDNFKLVNDSLGHPVGDLLLVSIANRLKSCVRSKDMVARLGGDEFVVLLDGVNTIEEAIHIAERHMAIVKQPMEIQTHRLVATISMGIVFNDFNEGAEGNLRDADIAMYRAKMNGRDRFEVFESHFRTETIERMNLENDLRRAIEQGEFRLHYQPIYSLMGKQVVGFEALLRWQHPERGILQPMEFIGVAEDAGLSLSLGNWVLREACTQLSKWQSKFPQIPSLTVSVNISGQQLAQPDFSSQVLHILDETGLKPESLALEITERALMQNVELVNQDLHVLREAGVQIQIDDFGIGYSSIVRLLQLPITAIKIDRYFIQRINQDGSKIVRAIQTMSKELGLVTIAEGVESETQVHCLASLGIDLVQGFLFFYLANLSAVRRWRDSLLRRSNRVI